MLNEVYKKHLIKPQRGGKNMLTVNPIKFNNIKPITFTEGNLNNITPNVAILSLQNPNAKINFENDQNRTKKADVVQSNLFVALGAKFRKAYDILFSPDYKNTEMPHITYMA